MEALQKWAALNASRFPEKLLLLLLWKRGERERCVRCRLCSRGVGLMSELCWSAAGIYTRAIRWEMEMEVLNFIHQKSPGNNIGREWFIDAVTRLSVSFSPPHSRRPPCFWGIWIKCIVWKSRVTTIYWTSSRLWDFFFFITFLKLKWITYIYIFR